MSFLFKAYCRAYQKTLKLAMNFLDWSEPELIQGAGAVKRLPAAVKAKNVNNVLVVTDKGLTGLHLLDGLYESLDAQGVKYTVYDGVQPNPTIDNIETAVELYKDNHCNGIIAFGGGSAGGVLLAKLMNLFLKEKINPLIGSAGVSAVPMAARVSQVEGQKAKPGNFLLMHAMGPNVAGVIGSAIAAGVFLSLFK